MVTRTEGDDWIVLQSEDHGYGVKDGAVFRWADSFCSQMVQGLGPCIAPRSSEIPAYANAPIGRQVAIGAYVGVPISDADGSLFGTLCAIDPKTQPESLHAELPLIAMLGRLLSCLLMSELKAIAIQRRVEKSNLKLAIDPETGLISSAGWESVIEAEERRCRVYGHQACIVAIRLNNSQLSGVTFSDALLETTSRLKGCLGSTDSLARVKPNLFLLMGAERNRDQAGELMQSIHNAMANSRIQIDISHAMRKPEAGMRDAAGKAISGLSESVMPIDGR
jgi:diguanylate cyclase